MIGHVWASGGGFKGIIRYMLTGDKGLSRVEDRVEWMGFVNLPTRDPEVAACMMAATAGSSVSNTKTPIYHFSVSCAPEDPVDRDMLRRIAARTIHDLGLQEYEVAVFAHKDRPHPHLHFVVNRVHPERRTLWSPWRDHYRIEHSLRAQEREFGLRIVPGWLAPVPKPEQGRARTVQGPQRDGAAEPQRPRPAPRRGDSVFLADVQQRALPVLEQARSWAELQGGLAEQGLSLRVKGGGFRMGDDRRDVKASDVARAFSRHHLEQRFGPLPDYHARMAVAVHTPVPPVLEAVPDALARREIPEPAPAAPADPPARAVEPAPTPHPVERTPVPEPAQHQARPGELSAHRAAVRRDVEHSLTREEAPLVSAFPEPATRFEIVDFGDGRPAIRDNHTRTTFLATGADDAADDLRYLAYCAARGDEAEIAYHLTFNAKTAERHAAAVLLKQSVLTKPDEATAIAPLVTARGDAPEEVAPQPQPAPAHDLPDTMPGPNSISEQMWLSLFNLGPSPGHGRTETQSVPEPRDTVGERQEALAGQAEQLSLPLSTPAVERAPGPPTRAPQESAPIQPSLPPTRATRGREPGSASADPPA
jgi:hypothetical protein